MDSLHLTVTHIILSLIILQNSVIYSKYLYIQLTIHSEIATLTANTATVLWL